MQTATRIQIDEALSRIRMLYVSPAFTEREDAQGLFFLRQACTLCEEGETAVLLVPLYEALIDLYDRMGQPREALRCSRRLREIERRLLSEQSDQRLRSLQMRFEVEKAQKDAEISHLRSVDFAGVLAETERLRALAEERARTDALTGISNRRYLEERLAAEVERARRCGSPLSVALVDVDHFKHINDTFGHAAGDVVLGQVAALMRTSCCLDNGNLVARYGGEEFALVLPETNYREALALCERLRLRVEQEDLSHIAPGLGPITVSAGLATTTGQATTAGEVSNVLGLPGEATEAAEANETTLGMYDILALSDRNLYAAKRAGRNKVVGTDSTLPDIPGIPARARR